jgi:hypothetical protein
MNAQTNELVQTWVAVTDESGRTHLEARWIDATPVPTHVTHAA